MRKRLEKSGATNLHVAQGFGSTEMSQYFFFSCFETFPTLPYSSRVLMRDNWLFGKQSGPAILMTPYRQDHKPTSSGVLLRNIEARIIDENGNDVAEGQPGELLVR